MHTHTLDFTEYFAFVFHSDNNDMELAKHLRHTPDLNEAHIHTREQCCVVPYYPQVESMTATLY